MALIACPGCGKEISERSVKCISCGYVLRDEPKPIENKCVECGAILSEETEICPNCGCPVEKEEEKTEDFVQKVEVQKVKVSKKTKIGIIVGVIAVVVIIAAALSTYFIIKSNNEKKAEEKAVQEYNDYIDNVNSVMAKMLSSGAQCESVSGLIHDVWYNTIYKKSSSTTDKYTHITSKSSAFNSDFNTSIANLMADSSFQSKVSSIKEDKENVDSIMKKLQSPPEGLQNCYDAINDLYEVYSRFVSLATNPSGNLTSYTSSCNTADSDFMTKYNSLKNKIPDKKTVGE